MIYIFSFIGYIGTQEIKDIDWLVPIIFLMKTVLKV
jgi:hypothetical protein